MGNMEWLEDIAHERAQGLVCGNDQADKLIAAVRLAGKGYRSGDVEEKPCKPS